MLIESMVRRTLGVKRHVVKRVFEEAEGLVVELDVRRGWRQPCGTCGTVSRVRDRLATREWRHVLLWGIPATLRYAPARVRCEHCGKILVETIPWSQGKCPLSQGLIWLLSSGCKLLPWNQVAKLFRVHWNTVAAAVQQAVAYGLEHRDLGHLEQFNLRSNRACLLKESFHEFWDYDTKDGARKSLKKWFWWATHSRLKLIRDFAWTMKNHIDDLLNYFELRIDNGAVEGMNNKAKVVSRRCYGFRTATWKMRSQLQLYL